MKLFIIDPGHGGMKDGMPITKGKRSPFSDLLVFEGEFNRSIADRIVHWSVLFGLNAIKLVPGPEDMPLDERVAIANEMYKMNPDCVYISIHSNAGGGKGIEVWTSPGDTKADPMATVFLKKLSVAFPEVKMRTDMTDGDPDKEANFVVLKDTRMPAILTENFFMDNYDEVKKYLLNERARDTVALAHLAAMIEIDNWKKGAK